MRLSTAVSLSIHLLTILFFFLAGLVFLALPFFQGIRVAFYELLIQNHLISFYIGGGLIALAIFMSVMIGIVYRKVYLTLELYSPSVQIDKQVILSCLESYWQHCFKKANPKIDVEIDSNQMLQITTERLPVDLDNEDHLKLLERELGFLLAHHFGYKKKFYLSFRI